MTFDLSTIDQLKPLFSAALGGLAMGLVQRYIYPWLVDALKSPATKKIQEYYWVIDAVLAEHPELKEKYVNPVYNIAESLLTDNEFQPEDIWKAASWAAEVFDFNKHEGFLPQDMTETQQKIASMAFHRIMR